MKQLNQTDVRALRQKMKLSQKDFGYKFGLSKHTVIGWETGRRKQNAASRVLLLVIDKYPNHVAYAVEISRIK